MHEMFAWYIDNNSYVTKEIVDQLVADITVADATGQSLTQVIEERAAKGNNSSPGSMFRDVGLIDKNDNASYALRLYKTGTYPFSNLIFDLFSKRNVAKKENIPLKPLVCLCKIFTLMYDLEIPKNERFITIAEVYEYISVLDSYEEINKDLVQKIVCERVYPSGSRIPTKRMKIKGDVCLRELFHMASETLVFNLGEEKTILVPEEKYIELMQYVSLMGYKLSNAPVVDGKKTRPYCEYLTNINHGIVEIIPDVPLKQDVIIPKNMTKGVFEYLFGVTGAKNIKWDIYFTEDCAGIYRIFYPIRWIALMQVYLQNKTIGEYLLDYAMQADNYIDNLKEGKLMIELPFENTNHTDISELTDGSSVNKIENVQEPTKKKLPVLSPRTNKKYPLNCILYGAPGTGKTYATAAYALAIAEDKELKVVEAESRQAVMQRYNQFIEDGRITFTTFHQSYGYEDFIQGMRPDTSSKNGGLNFKTVDGVFKEIAERAFEDPNNDYVILIDEINRANISKVFGELITLIEDDKRWGELNAINVTLPSGEIFAVPNNLYIVGTMNSADKSISLIDTALRRRFVFIEYKPKLALVKDDTLRNVLETLNKGISNELRSTDLLIGHSYFLNKTAADLPEIMNRSIIPLLYEYFFDDRKKVLAHVNKAIDGLDLEVDANPFGRVSVRKKGAEE